MQKTLLFSSILFGLLNIPSIIFSYPYEYKDFYVLGDSLNDSTDKSKLVSGGDTNPTQSESLSQKIFKRPLIDYKNGGTNFSLFGNEIHELVQEMDEEGFNIHQIGNNNLIFLSIGNNDIITEFWYHPFKWLVQDQLHYNDKITTQLSTLAKVVGNNQANTVMVNTIPDMTLTPLFSSILVFPRIDIPQYIDFYYNIPIIREVSQSLYTLSYDLFNFPLIKEPMKWIGIYTPQAMREYALNFHPNTNLSIHDNVRNYTLGLYEGTLIGTILPMPFIYDTLTGIFRDYTQQFNDTYIQKILNIDENIVILDINQVLTDILQNYQAFGFDDYVSTACSAGTLSLINQVCDENSKFIDESRVHVFGDLIHPSAMAHLGLGDYILSVLNAPIQYSSVLLQQIYILNNIEQNIQREIHGLLSQPLLAQDSKMILNYSLSHNQLRDYQGIRSQKII